MSDDNLPKVTLLRHGDKEAVRFTTPSGITAIVATMIDPALLRKLRKQLERKLRVSGHPTRGS